MSLLDRQLYTSEYQTMENGYPELHSFARNKSISTKEFYAQQHRPDLFSLYPLSAEAYT